MTERLHFTSKSKPGRLFVFEGIDGSGKTTLAKAFAELLRYRDLQCEYFAFPGAEDQTLGKLVYELHHGAHTDRVASISPTSLQLLHIAAHIDAIDTKIMPILTAGRIVVLDRFWWSTWVYGIRGGVDPRSLQAMIDLERLSWNSILPSAVFLLERNESVSAAQVDPHVTSLLRKYRELAEREAPIYPVLHVSNDGDLDTVVESLYCKVLRVPENHAHRGFKRDCEDVSKQRPLFDQDCVPHAPAPRLIFSRLAPAKPTIVYDTYWRFAAERQEIFFRRFRRNAPPWTVDPILQEHKFTNAYRASDRVSQYLIRNVIYAGDDSPKEVFFRIILFKIFNRIETWELLQRELGQLSAEDFSIDRYDRILTKAMAAGDRIYSAAYIMPSGGLISDSGRKHKMHLALIDRMMQAEVSARLIDCPQMSRAFELLRSYPTLGDFLAYQYVTDLNYSELTSFSEMEFVMPGPGARSGIRKCFTDLGGLNESEIIKMVTDRQEIDCEALGVHFQPLWGRRLQLIDCQNLFCEVDKYSRIKHPEFSLDNGRTRIKQKYRLNRNQIEYWYPPKWGLNDRIETEIIHV